MFYLQMGESSEEERWQEMVEEMEKKSAKDRKQQVLAILENKYILLKGIVRCSQQKRAVFR